MRRFLESVSIWQRHARTGDSVEDFYRPRTCLHFKFHERDAAGDGAARISSPVWFKLDKSRSTDTDAAVMPVIRRIVVLVLELVKLTPWTFT